MCEIASFNVSAQEEEESQRLRIIVGVCQNIAGFEKATIPKRIRLYLIRSLDGGSTNSINDYSKELNKL